MDILENRVKIADVQQIAKAPVVEAPKSDDRKLLGLNIIVGAKEQDELERCLKSCQGALFDEIVVTVTSDDPDVRAVAEKYATKVEYFKWISDFSAARNYSFSKSTTKFILWCFHPDTRVCTEKGLVPISQVQIGDKVLTHTGRFMPVTKTYVRDYEGLMCRMKGKMGDRDILATPNHEFYSEKIYQCRTGVKFCKPDCAKQWSKRYLEKFGCLSRQCKQGYQNYEYSFKPCSELKSGDIVSFPRMKQVRIDPLFLNLPTDRKGRAILPQRIEVTPSVMKLFGYFVAEGTTCTKKGTVSFCFNKNEVEYQQDVLQLMRQIFGVEGTLYVKEEHGSCTVTFCSVVLADFFNRLFNGLQPVRRIPTEFFSLSDRHIAEFLKTYYRGDGGENPDSFAITTTSSHLVYQVRLLLSRFGICADVIPYKEKKAWKICVGGKQMSIFEDIVGEKHDKEAPNSYNKFFYTDSSYIYYPIESYSTEMYSGPVYNLEVEEDHTYVVEYALCHNCDADDVIKPSAYQKLLELKPKIERFDIILIDYNYTHDDQDRPVLVLPRERIVRNCDKIKWHDPIHEYLNMDVPVDKIYRAKIAIDHYRTRAFNPQRNLDLLKIEYAKPGCSQRIKFYYGKELSDVGNWEESVRVLEDYLKDETDFRDNMVVACIRLSKYYFDKKDYSTAKSYAMRGMRYNSIYAENYVTMGTISEIEGDTESGIRYYKEALTKKLEGGMSQLVDFYGFIPAVKLCIIYRSRRKYEESLKYCDIALKHKPDNAQVQEMHKAILNEMAMSDEGKTIEDAVFEKVKKFLADYAMDVELTRNNSEYAELRLRKTQDVDVVWLIPMLDLDNPAVRIRRYSVSQKMTQLGYKSRVITDYYGKNVLELRNEIGDANTIICTFCGKYERDAMAYLKHQGKKVVVDLCEAVFEAQNVKECLKEADLITCCSTKLADMCDQKGYKNVTVIQDPYEEVPAGVQAVYENRYEKPKAIYGGMGGNSFLVTDVLKDVIEEAGYELVVMTEWDNATVKWTRDTWAQEMVKCDVVLCPQRGDIQPAKSSVKAVVAMSMGMPVIASLLQSYKEVITNGANGYFADKKEQWKDALLKLKDPAERKRVGEIAKNSVQKFSPETIAREWHEVLKDLTPKRSVPQVSETPVEEPKERPLVDIIISSYNNVEYLKLCVTSILLNTAYPYHIIISDGGSNEETWTYLKALKGITILGSPDKRLSYSETCNAGILKSQTKYFVILNSDVVVSKGWLNNMVDKMDSVPRLAVCGVLSNCDRGWLYDVPNKSDSPKYPMRLEKAGIELVPGMKMETMKPHIEELYAFMEESNNRLHGTFVRQAWVAVYATIFARCAINEIGLFDPQYKNGCEDLDLCRRLSDFGYVQGQAIDAFVYHFGGISRKAYQDQGKEAYDKEDAANHAMYRAKWDKKRVAIWTGPAWEPWNKAKVDEGMAGSETWAAYLAREFVRRGYRCTIYNDLLTDDKSKPVYDEVTNQAGQFVGQVIYRDHTQLQKDVSYDVIHEFISSRSLEPLKQNVHSCKNYVMIHDIWLHPDKNFDVMPWMIHGYAYLSEWHKHFLKQHHTGIPEDKMFLTANGIDQDLYKDVDTVQKKNQIVYSSSPDRGLFELLRIWPELRKAVPDLQLIVAYGFFNWESSAKTRGDQKMLEFIGRIKEAMKQDGVQSVGRVSKRELARYQMESKVWLYPTWFTETFCCSAVECGLSKCALLSSDLAALKTTVGTAGILLPGQSTSPEYLERFTAESIKLLTDEEYRLSWANKAYEKAKVYSWAHAADTWIQQFKK